ncbi:MAG TPA: HAD family hydrolase [Deltaproteobacteria bacterium]|nr:HAD family hydrolase [Deltaproteobacteria bacterium]
MNESIIARLPKSLVPIPTGLEPVGQLEIPVKAVLFDIYGTLFISESGDIGIAEEKSRISAGLKDLLIKNHIDTPPDTILKTFFSAIRATHKRLRAIGVDHPEVEIDLIWSEVLGINNRQSVREYAVEFELLANPVYPMPHLKEILVHCKDSGIPMGIISNAQFYTPLLFNWYLGSDPEDLGFFTDLIIYSYQTGHAKPSMVLFDIAVKRLRKYNINPRSVVYVGNDMLNDVYPADRVGFQTALFAGDDRSLRLRDNDPRCSDISANLVITDLIQLIEYIG